MEKNLPNNLENAFADVRRAYRLIAQLQSRIRDLVFYIKSQTIFNASDVAGIKKFSDTIGTKRPSLDDYANLKITPDMCTWNFLYGYLFEFYFSEIKEKKTKKTCAMSVYIVNDDGYAISSDKKKSKTAISSFAPVEESHSYIVLMYGDGRNWMRGDYDYYIYSFLGKSKMVDKDKDDKDGVFIAKKYPMHTFANQEQTDLNLKDFADIVIKESGVNILPEE